MNFLSRPFDRPYEPIRRKSEIKMQRMVSNVVYMSLQAMTITSIPKSKKKIITKQMVGNYSRV